MKIKYLLLAIIMLVGVGFAYQIIKVGEDGKKFSNFEWYVELDTSVTPSDLYYFLHDDFGGRQQWCDEGNGISKGKFTADVVNQNLASGTWTHWRNEQFSGTAGQDYSFDLCKKTAANTYDYTGNSLNFELRGAQIDSTSTIGHSTGTDDTSTGNGPGEDFWDDQDSEDIGAPDLPTNGKSIYIKKGWNLVSKPVATAFILKHWDTHKENIRAIFARISGGQYITLSEGEGKNLESAFWFYSKKDISVDVSYSPSAFSDDISSGWHLEDVSIIRGAFSSGCIEKAYYFDTSGNKWVKVESADAFPDDITGGVIKIKSGGCGNGISIPAGPWDEETDDTSTTSQAVKEIEKPCVGFHGEDLQFCCDLWIENNNFPMPDCEGLWVLEEDVCSWECGAVGDPVNPN